MECVDMAFYNMYSRQKARKDHQCSYCKKTITDGEIYSYQRDLINKRFYVTKLCLVCDQIVTDSAEGDVECDCIGWQEVTNYLHEKYCSQCKYSTNCINYEEPQKCISIRESATHG